MKEQNIFARLIAQSLNLNIEAVGNTLSLLEEGCTIPFISRYRKERTGALDEVQIAAINDENERLKEEVRYWREQNERLLSIMEGKYTS